MGALAVTLEVWCDGAQLGLAFLQLCAADFDTVNVQRSHVNTCRTDGPGPIRWFKSPPAGKEALSSPVMFRFIPQKLLEAHLLP